VTLKGNGNGSDAGWSGRFRATPLGLVPQVDPVRHTADLLYELSPYSLAARGQQTVHAVGSVAAPLLGMAPAGLPQRTAFAKDQMVTVYVPLGVKRVETVVPYSAFVFDAFGGAWIYLERTEAKAKEHRFERRRVEMGPVIGGEFVIRPGLTSSDRVVVTGAGFLFSREFHSPPVAAGHKQDIDDDD